VSQDDVSQLQHEILLQVLKDTDRYLLVRLQYRQTWFCGSENGKTVGPSSSSWQAWKAREQARCQDEGWPMSSSRPAFFAQHLALCLKRVAAAEDKAM
jgi:hypothetical protein